MNQKHFFKGGMKILVSLFILAFFVTNDAISSYESGIDDGYFWSLWTDDGSGYVNYSNGDGGNYSVSWNYDGNFTCGKGWSSGDRNRIVGYNCGSYTQSGGGGSFAYYGWTRDPLIEYYVNEMWRTTRPAAEYRGTVYSDGATYDIYTAMRYNAPSIDGTQTFRQIFSTRQLQNSTGANHTITFANHANAWGSAGLYLGSDYSPAAILLTEAWGTSNGYSNATVWNAGSSSSSSSGEFNGVYSFIAQHSGKAIDTYNFGTANGTNICQWSYWGGDSQKYQVTHLGDGWHRISPVISTSQGIDISGASTADGANVQTWSYWGGTNQQFAFISNGSGRYQIRVRHSGKCLDVEGVSTADGANIHQWTCNGGSNQLFELRSVNSANGNSFELVRNITIHPNPVNNILNITLPESDINATISVFNSNGKLVMSDVIFEQNNKLDVSSLKSGLYFLVLNYNDKLIHEKFIKE